ncbi:MAG TPA: trehalose-phosphatase [Caldimonas sp.]|jgi:trehalose 6-phosphate phosphatase
MALASVMRLGPLLAFDFDGTLAPIVDHPDDAHVSAPVARCLRRLARALPIAIITGRSVADVRLRLGFEPRFVIGNHGIEDAGAGADDGAERALDPLRLRIVAAAASLAATGVAVEDKRYSLAFHYRLAADAGAALACIDSLLDGSAPALRRFGGKFIVNVVAAGSPDKGDALAAIVARAGADAAVFVGDDVNDEAVFERAAPPWLTIRIGRDPLSAAMYVLESEAELVRMLERMLALAVTR